jgi:uncharacterized protein
MTGNTPATRAHALVLGGTGFLGESLLRQVVEEDGMRVTVLAHRRQPRGLPDDCRLVRGHLAFCDLTWVQDDPPDYVFHCARLQGQGKLGRRWAATVGRYGNRRLARKLGQCAKRPRLVYASGSLMYGDRGEAWVDENAAIAPTSFAREYVIAERPFLKGQRFPVMMVRPGWVVGDGSWLRSFFFGPAEQESAVPVYGGGENWMSLIHREDVAALMRRAARIGKPGAVYNLAAEPPLKQHEFVEHLAAELKLPVREKTMETRAVREAFTASIKLRSRHEDFFREYDWRFSTPFRAVDHALGEYKARIHPTTRQASD